MGDTSAVNHVTSYFVAASRSNESSPKTNSAQKRSKEEEGDQIVLRIPRFAFSYLDASFLENIGPSLLLLKDEHNLSAIVLVCY